MTAKKILVILIVGVALTFVGCSMPFGAPATTPTPPPTYTPFPTYTPLPTYTLPPSPTATFPPTATLPPLETSTPEPGAAVPTSSLGDVGGGLQTVVVYATLLRAGPAQTFKEVTKVPAGTEVVIQGRNNPAEGFVWLFVRVPSGKEGWIRETQFSGLNLASIPVAPEIPTPSITDTPRPGSTAAPAGTAAPGGAPTSASTGEILFSLSRGGGEQCQAVSWWYVLTPVLLTDPTKTGISLFDKSNTSLNGKGVFQLVTTGVPSGITVKVQGEVTGLQCHPTLHTCQYVSFTLCASAGSGVSASKYSTPVILRFGKQEESGMTSTVDSGVPTVFNVQ